MRSYDAYGYSDDPYREGLIEANSPNDSSMRDTDAFSYRLPGNRSVNDNTYLTQPTLARYDYDLIDRVDEETESIQVLGHRESLPAAALIHLSRVPTARQQL